MQLNTLSVFLGIPVPAANEPLRSRVRRWAAAAVLRGFDVLFLTVGVAVLAGAVTADLDAGAYWHATSTCTVSPSSIHPRCYEYLPVTVVAIGQRSFSNYAMTLQSYGRTLETTTTSGQVTYAKFHVGQSTIAKRWSGKVTGLWADTDTWAETTDNPLHSEGPAHAGIPSLIVALTGLLPLLSRLHPIIT